MKVVPEYLRDFDATVAVHLMHLNLTEEEIARVPLIMNRLRLVKGIHSRTHQHKNEFICSFDKNAS